MHEPAQIALAHLSHQHISILIYLLFRYKNPICLKNGLLALRADKEFYFICIAIFFFPFYLATGCWIPGIKCGHYTGWNL